MSQTREIMKSFYADPYVARVIESASAREGVPCRVTDNPIDGVAVVRDDSTLGAPVVVELNEGEKTYLLIAVGKAFAKLVRS